MENFNRDFGPKVEPFTPSSRRYWSKQCKSWIHQERPGVRPRIVTEEMRLSPEAQEEYNRSEKQLEFNFNNPCTGEEDECTCNKCK